LIIQQPSETVMPRSYPPEFRRKVLDLVASGRKVADSTQLGAVRALRSTRSGSL
jgi:hypothetical protein